MRQWSAEIKIINLLRPSIISINGPSYLSAPVNFLGVDLGEMYDALISRRH